VIGSSHTLSITLMCVYMAILIESVGGKAEIS